ncbi:MAG: MarR family transcriptional regulator [Phycisphaerales bacterium]
MNDETDMDGPEATVTGSAGRALLVLGLVLDHGPVSPQRLTSLSGLSRTAVHRAIHALINQGYVRYQLGKMHVIVTANLRDRFRGAFFSSPQIDPVSKAVDEALKHRRIQCEIAVLSQAGEARIVETTTPEEDTEVDFFESDLVSVLLSHFDPVAVTRITARALRAAGAGVTVEPEFLDRYRQAQYQGYIWNAQQGALCVRVPGDSDQAVAFRLISRGSGRHRQRDCVETAEAIGRGLPGMFPNFATFLE